jgi:hypothetical protein
LHFVVFLAAGAKAVTDLTSIYHNCRSQPGDFSFPSELEFQKFNQSIEGRLVPVVPSAKFCKERGGCTDAEWADAAFRSTIPGAMFQASSTLIYFTPANIQPPLF